MNLKSANLHINTSEPLKVFLIGMMGSGKSYWAEMLKKKIKVPAYDLDSLVEMMQEKTIAELFADEGEDYFRKEEAKMLRLFKEKKQFILSCGGGTPCFHDNMDWMNKQGITIWIDEPVAVLAARLMEQKEHRPLISNLDDQALTAYLQAKLEERHSFYAKATYTLAGEEINEANLVKLIKAYA
jgi:shikimate kinase